MEGGLYSFLKSKWAWQAIADECYSLPPAQAHILHTEWHKGNTLIVCFLRIPLPTGQRKEPFLMCVNGTHTPTVHAHKVLIAKSGWLLTLTQHLSKAERSVLLAQNETSLTDFSPSSSSSALHLFALWWSQHIRGGLTLPLIRLWGSALGLKSLKIKRQREKRWYCSPKNT